MDEAQDEPSKQSRWQQLFGATSCSNIPQYYSKTSSNVSSISFEDSKSVNEWFENLDNIREADAHVGCQNGNIELDDYSCHHDAEAMKILDDLEGIIRDHDDKLMETVLTSDRHDQVVSRFRSEKVARECIRRWHDYTKNNIARLNFLVTAVEDRRVYSLISTSFQIWRNACQVSITLIKQFQLKQQKQLLKRVLWFWQDKILEELKASKVRMISLFIPFPLELCTLTLIITNKYL